MLLFFAFLFCLGGSPFWAGVCLFLHWCLE